MSSSSEVKRGRIIRGTTAPTSVELALTEFDAMVPDSRGGSVAVDPRIVEDSRRLGHDEGYRAGYEEGFAQGRHEGMEAARQRIAETEAQADEQIREMSSIVSGLITAFERALSDVVDRREDGLADLDRSVAEGAITLAEIIVGRELRDPQVRAVDALTRALAMAPEQGPVIAHLHPVDCEYLEMLEPPTSERVTFQPDAGIASGDCVIEFGHGEVDARIATAITRARAAIEEGSA